MVVASGGEKVLIIPEADTSKVDSATADSFEQSAEVEVPNTDIAVAIGLDELVIVVNFIDEGGHVPSLRSAFIRFIQQSSFEVIGFDVLRIGIEDVVLFSLLIEPAVYEVRAFRIDPEVSQELATEVPDFGELIRRC